MASTFNENKKIKCDQYPCQSWYRHVGIDKSNSCSARYFRERRNRKTSSKSDEASDLPSTSQVNGHDSDLEEDESSDDPDHNRYLYPSDLTELWLANCDKCDNFYYPQAFSLHNEIRHLQPQDPKAIQYSFYQKKPKPIPKPKPEKKKKAKNETKNTSDVQNKNSEKADTSKNNDSEANVVDNLDVKSGPGHGKKRKRKRITYGPKKRRKQVPIDNENIEETSLQNITKSATEVPLVNGNIEDTSLQNITKSIIEVLENGLESSLEIVTAISIEELEDEQKVICQPQTSNCQLKRTTNCQLKKGVNCQLKKGVNCQLKKGVNCQLEKGVNCQLEKGVNCQLKEGVICQLKEGVICQLKEGVICQLERGVDYQQKTVVDYQLKSKAYCQLKGAANCQLKRVVNCQLKRAANCQLKRTANCQLKRTANCQLKRTANCQPERAVDYQLKRIVNCQFERTVNCHLKRAVNYQMKKVVNCHLKGAVNSQMKGILSCQLKDILNYYLKRTKNYQLEGAVNYQLKRALTSYLKRVLNFQLKGVLTRYFKRVMKCQLNKSLNGYLKRAQNGMKKYPMNAKVFAYQALRKCSVQFNVSTQHGSLLREKLVFNQSTNFMKKLSVPRIVDDVINCKTKDYSNFPRKNQNIFYKYKLASLSITRNNIFCYNNHSLVYNSPPAYSSPFKLESLVNEVVGRNNLKNHINCTPTNNFLKNMINANLSFEKLYNGMLPKRFNGFYKEKSAQKNSTVIPLENKKKDSSFHKENIAYLNSIMNGPELSYRKCIRKTKPGVKLKRQKIRTKLKAALESPIYKQCLQTIKLNPVKIQKALNSVDILSKVQAKEQFRTFSDLNYILPSDKNFNQHTRLTCSVNTSAKSGCINSWNNVPFRNQSRKCFFPLSGNRQANSGLILSNNSYDTLRATFDNQNELDTSPMHSEELDFIPNSHYESTAKTQKSNHKESIMLESEFEKDLYEEPRNGSPSYVNSPSKFEELENDLYEEQQNESPSASYIVNSPPEIEEFERDHFEEQLNRSPSPNVNSASSSNLVSVKINDSPTDSSYLNEYNQDTGQLQEMSTIECTPISRPNSPEPDCEMDGQETELIKKTSSSSNMPREGMFLVMPNEIFWQENGLNGNKYRDYNREQNQGSKDR